MPKFDRQIYIEIAFGVWNQTIGGDIDFNVNKQGFPAMPKGH